MKATNELLLMALLGYEQTLKNISSKMDEIRQELRGEYSPTAKPEPVQATAKKRHMSAAGRKRIAAAQKARWKAFHQEKGAAA